MANDSWKQTSDSAESRRGGGQTTRRVKLCDSAYMCRDRAHQSDNEVGGVYAEAENRVQEAAMAGKLSNRRYRRWANDRILRELAPPLDAVDIGELFAPPPWGARLEPSPFERVTELGAHAADVAAWSPFVNNVDMDWQAKQLERSGSYKKKTIDITSQKAAMLAWRKVDSMARFAIKRNSSSPLLLALEEKLLTYLEEVEKGNVVKDLVLDVDSPYHRLLLHGISQFHGLVTQSLESMETRGMAKNVSVMKKMCIRRKSCKDETVASYGKPLNLHQFLQEIQQGQNVLVA